MSKFLRGTKEMNAQRAVPFVHFHSRRSPLNEGVDKTKEGLPVLSFGVLGFVSLIYSQLGWLCKDKGE